MKSVAVSQKLAVAPQPKLSDFQEFKRRGFATIINNRPDGEDPSQPGSAAEAEAARAAALQQQQLAQAEAERARQDAELSEALKRE